VSEKSVDRGVARASESRDPSRDKTVTTLKGTLDEEEADRREMAEIQGRIEARRAAKKLEVARETMKELKSSMGGATVVPPKRSKRATQRSKGNGKKELGTTNGTNKVLAKPVARGLVNSQGDDALSTLKFIAIEGTSARHSLSTDEASGVELGIALVGSALGKKVPQKSSGRAPAGMSECYVDLAPTQRKSRMTVSAAPPNSIDSDDQELAEASSEMPLSHPDVHIGFPGDSVKTATVVKRGGEPIATEGNYKIAGQEPTPPCAIETVDGGTTISGDLSAAPAAWKDGEVILVVATTGMAANEEVSDDPVAPGVISTPVLALASGEKILAEKDKQKIGNQVPAGQTEKADLQQL